MDRQYAEKNRKRVLVVMPSMSMGGAEQLTLNIMQSLDRGRYEIGLCLFETRGALLEKIPENVKLFPFEKKSKWSIVRLILQLVATFRQYRPAVVYTRMWYATFIAVIARKLHSRSLSHIATEEHRSTRDIKNKGIERAAKMAAIKWAYRRAHLVAVMSEGVKREIAHSYGIKPERIRVIYGAVDVCSIESRAKEEIPLEAFFANNSPIVVTLGRLIARKGFSDLIRAISLLRSGFSLNLAIIGDGEERTNLENLVAELQLAHCVKLLGYQDNPYKYIAKCDVFVLSSHWEGFANVIIEAMACGVAVISTDCCHGPQEIINHGINGLLVPVGDIYSLARSIQELLEDKQRRKLLARAGKERALDFSINRMVREYEEAIDCLGKKF